MKKERLKYLLKQYTQGQATQAEKQELQHFLQSGGQQDLFTEELAVLMEESREEDFDYTPYLSLSQEILNLDKGLKTAEESEAIGMTDRRRSKKVWYWTAAASLILLLGAGIYRYMAEKEAPATLANQKPADVPTPSVNKAMITLADGSQVYLDSVTNGQLAQQGNIKLIKLDDGQIAYQTVDGKVLKEPQYNTLTNPNGSKVIDMLLSDGSHVWLNAGSSIRYPVAFVGSERKVELNGEGYFEITRDPVKRFVVVSNDLKTEVLGTSFNVKAYRDEAEIKVTLLSGSVKVSPDNAAPAIIVPGQQARLLKNHLVVRRANIDNVMSWKNGYFSLDELPFDDIMRQLERWYNIDVVYGSGAPPHIELFGKIGRDLNLTEVVNSLSDMGVTCKIENKSLYIN